jgi:hypothetical protein
MWYIKTMPCLPIEISTLPHLRNSALWESRADHSDFQTLNYCLFPVIYQRVSLEILFKLCISAFLFIKLVSQFLFPSYCTLGGGEKVDKVVALPPLSCPLSDLIVTPPEERFSSINWE